MPSNSQSQFSRIERFAAGALAAFSMFVVGYSATRVFLAQPDTSVNVSPVVPHEASLWSVLGER